MLNPENYWAAIPLKMIVDPDMTEGCYRVYGFLYWWGYYYKETVISVGNNLIARELGISNKTVHSALQLLVEKGYIVAEPGDDLRHRYCLYGGIEWPKTQQ